MIFNVNSSEYHMLGKLNDLAVEILESFKYGNIFGYKVSVEIVDNLFRKATQMMFLMQKLKSF